MTDEQRTYQIVAVRMHDLDQTRMCMVEEIWRCSIGRKRKAGAKPSEAEIPAAQCRWLRLVELEKMSATTYQATATSPSFVVDPVGEEANVLYHVPAEVEDSSP